MTQIPTFSAKQIAKFIEGVIEGDPNAMVERFGQIDQCPEKGLTFLTDQKYAHFLYDTKASIAIVSQDFEPEEPVSCTLIRVKNPKKTFVTLLQFYDELKPKRLGISKQAIINKSAVIGQGVYIGDGTVVEEDVEIKDDAKIYPQVYLGNNVSIGENTIIYAGVKIYEGCKIGNNCIIHSGAVIGADGFGYIPDEKGALTHIPQMGTVILEDDVEIGANTCIDRGSLADTIIGHHTKINNLCHIAHNNVIGNNVEITGCCNISGSNTIEDDVWISPNSSVRGWIHIGKGATVGMGAVVVKNIPEGETWAGNPARKIEKK